MTHGERPASLRARAARATAWSAAEIGTRYGIQLAAMVVLARLLSPEDFGLMAMVLVFTTVGALLVDSGLGAALIQRQDTDQDDETSAFLANLGLGASAGLALFLAAPWIAGFFNNPGLAVLIQAMSITLPLSALATVPDALLTQRLRFKDRSRVELLSSIAGVTVGVWMAWRGFGVLALAGQAITGIVFRVSALWLVSGWRPRGRFSPGKLRVLVRFGGLLLLANLSDTIYVRLQSVLIGHRFSERDLGFYAMAQGTQQVPTMLAGSLLNRVGLPLLASVAGNPTVSMSVLRQAVRASLLGFAPVMAAIATFASPLVDVAFGAAWTPVAPLLTLLAMGAITWPWLVLTLVALNASGRPVEVLKLELLKKPVAIALLLLALPWGVQGVAASVACAAAFATIMHGLRCHQVLGYRWREQAADLVPPLAAAALAAAAAAAVVAALGTGAASLALAMGVFLLAWAVSAHLLARPAINDLSALVRVGRGGPAPG